MPPEHTFRIGARGAEGREITVELPEGEPRPWGLDAKLSVVGADTPRLDGRDKVTGRARYTADIRRPGMLWGAMLRSPWPHARLISLDIEAARSRPGVRAVHLLEEAGEGEERRTRFEGDAVAALAADTPEAAEGALAALRPVWEPLPASWEAEPASRPESPRVFPDRPNAGEPQVAGDGREDLAALFATPGATVVEMEFRTRVQTHACLETHGVVCEWRGEDLHVWASTQGTFAVREGLATALEIPSSRVHVICEHMGGGFGSKLGPVPFGLAAARLARETGRPVRMVLDRRDEHLCTGNRPGATIRMRAAASREGDLLAVEHESFGSPGVGRGAGTGRPVANLYAPQGRRISDQDVRTHTGFAMPMRAPGHPQGVFAYEQVIDELAHRLGQDPVEFRRRNDDHPFRPAQLAEGARSIGWSRRRPSGSLGGTVRTGLGCASSVWYDFGGPGAVVTVRVSPDGSVEVINGAQDIGTGTRTVMAVIAAEELGLDPRSLRVRLGHTDDPVGPQSGGSLTVPTLAPAVRTAAYRARRKLAELAAPLLETTADRVEPRGGQWHSLDEPGRSLPFRQVAATLGDAPLEVQGERLANFEGLTSVLAGCQFVEARVDLGTGRVRATRVVAVHDCGRAVNALTARSQVHGGVIQALSYALLEERVLHPADGRMVNANLESYKIAGPREAPEIEVILWDSPVGINNTSTLGIGEPPTIPTAAALANAFFNATGVRMRELPMTPARVLAALEDARRGEEENDHA